MSAVGEWCQKKDSELLYWEMDVMLLFLINSFCISCL